jgi:hypothetical protein
MTSDAIFEMITIDLDDPPAEDDVAVQDDILILDLAETPLTSQEAATPPEATADEFNTAAEDTAAEDTAAEDTTAEDTNSQETPLVATVVDQPTCLEVRLICDRIHQAIKTDQQTPVLVLLASESALPLAGAARRVVAGLVQSFGAKVLVVDLSAEKTLAQAIEIKTDGSHVTDSSLTKSPCGRILPTGCHGLFCWTADAPETRGDGRSAVKAIEGLRGEYRLIVAYADSSCLEAAESAVRISSGSVTLASLGQTRIKAAKKLRRRLKSWGASLLGSVLVQPDNA